MKLVFLFSALFLFSSFSVLDTKKSSNKFQINSELKTGLYYVSEKVTNYKRNLEKSTESYYINPAIIIGVDEIKNIEISTDKYDPKPTFNLTLDKKGTEKWRDATSKQIGKRIALIVDDKLITCPKVSMTIEGGKTAFLFDNYSKEELEILIDKILVNH